VSDASTTSPQISAPGFSTRQVASIVAVSAGARAAGSVIALGYLLGFVGGPVLAVIGGLALITYGRALLVDRGTGLVAGASLAIAAGALGVGALRWGSLSLGDLRGVQSVLGPTLLVGPDKAAIASAIAAGSALIALSVWMASFGEGIALRSRRALVWLLEGAVGSFAVVTVFFDPAESALAGGDLGRTLLTIGRWAGSVAGAALLVGALAVALTRGGHRFRAAGLAVAAIGVAVAAVIVVGII
jgi:hypothetical protein